MGQKGPEFAKVYTGKALIADPIYQYAWFTVPEKEHPDEKTEKDLLDSPWLQRLQTDSPAPERPLGLPRRRAQPVPALAGRHAHGGRIQPAPLPQPQERLPRYPLGQLRRAAGPPRGTSARCGAWPLRPLLRRSLPRPVWDHARGSRPEDHHEETGQDDHGHQAKPHGPLRQRGGDRPGPHCVHHQDARRAGRQTATLAGAAAAAFLGHLHGRQPRLRPARCVHDGLFAGHGGHLAPSLLHVFHRERDHPAPGRHLGPLPVPQRPAQPVPQRLLSSYDPGARFAPAGDLSRHHGPAAPRGPLEVSRRVSRVRRVDAIPGCTVLAPGP